MTSSQEGSVNVLIFMDPFSQYWTEKWTKLASLMLCNAVIHCKERKLIQHPLSKLLVECCHQGWFQSGEPLFCSIYLVPRCTFRMGCGLWGYINYRWLGDLHYDIHLFPPLLLSHFPFYKLLMSHNLCMAVIRSNEVPTTLGWLNPAATRRLICDRAQPSRGPYDRSTMQANTGLSFSKFALFLFDFKTPSNWRGCQVLIRKLEKEKLSY